MLTVTMDNAGKDNDANANFLCEEEPHTISPNLGYGFYPLSIGQYLNHGKLEIVRKLGWGLGSSVWLARTHENAYSAGYVAVKVCTIAASVSGLPVGGEADLLIAIKTAKPDHPGYKHCLHIDDTLFADSYHGRHTCLVTEVLGNDLNSLRRERRNGDFNAFPLPLAKRIIKQTLLALDYIHSACGLVHGDIKSSTILVSMEYTDEDITLFLEKHPSTTYAPRIELELSADPIISVKSQPLPNFGLKADTSNLEIRLISYRQAIPVQDSLKEQVKPDLVLRAPEIILGHPLSAPVDIWSVGCLVFDYMTGACLFKLDESPSRSEDFDEVHLLQQMLELVGPFQASFLQDCERQSSFFDEQGALSIVGELPPRTIEQRLRLLRTSEKDVPGAAAFIRRCLTIDPRARPTALELLSDQWLVDARD